jgi:hypothetical protein
LVQIWSSRVRSAVENERFVVCCSPDWSVAVRLKVYLTPGSSRSLEVHVPDSSQPLTGTLLPFLLR